jgi:hypothetical protein
MDPTLSKLRRQGAQRNSSAIVPIGKKRRRGAFGSAMKPYFE